MCVVCFCHDLCMIVQCIMSKAWNLVRLKMTCFIVLFVQKQTVLPINGLQNARFYRLIALQQANRGHLSNESPYHSDSSGPNYHTSCISPLTIIRCPQSLFFVQKMGKMYC